MGVEFQLPDKWLDWFREFGDNIHLTHSELESVARGEGEWDAGYASVCNAVLPFERCVAHVGDSGWGASGVSYVGLQMRVYQVPYSPGDTLRRVKEVGAADIKRFSGTEPEIETIHRAHGWSTSALRYPNWCGDYGGIANVDFRVADFDGQTVIVVFMYTSQSRLLDTRDIILKSFRVKNRR
jgi:hypothetical protein